LHQVFCLAGEFRIVLARCGDTLGEAVLRVDRFA
jgi:hypothetical protein